jgi:CRISPR-associated protein Csd1
VVKEWWNSQLGSTDASVVEGLCLVTGRIGRVAATHEPQIKGVNGQQPGGALLVSFNAKAYESFGREQSFNAPVSDSAAFQYCTALNHLLRQGGGKIQIGDATTVYWTESPSPMEEFFSFVADPAKVSAEDDAQKQKVQATLQRIVQGESVEELELGTGDTPFYVLGLSPNAARLSIRFWYVSTLTEMVAALRQHFSDLAIVRSSDRDPEFPAMWQLLRETVRDSKDIPPLLSGVVMRAILMGSPYPQMLFSAVLRRIRADRVVNAVRAGMLKACLNRNSRIGISPLIKDISMSLDPDRPEPAYQLGRLFAELEKTQEDALPGINATIKDRYFGAASATPASVFPRIIRGSQHHLGKLEYRSKIYREKQIQEICGKLNGFPSHLNLNDQGLFALGYYHQRQSIFTKKAAPEDSAVNA